jgi:hypothetical protein
MGCADERLLVVEMSPYVQPSAADMPLIVALTSSFVHRIPARLVTISALPSG